MILAPTVWVLPLLSSKPQAAGERLVRRAQKWWKYGECWIGSSVFAQVKRATLVALVARMGSRTVLLCCGRGGVVWACVYSGDGSY